jgi:hypothetical protein
MISLNAHYDGKVIIPDAPLNLPANQRVRISVEPIDTSSGRPRPVTFSKLIGEALKTPANPNPRFPSDNDDALWGDDPEK